MLALSIRQPYAEEILRGMKVVEYRSGRTWVIGRRFYIYASRTAARGEDIAGRFAWLGEEPGGLPVGQLVGTAVICRCTGERGSFEWHLSAVRRLKRPRKPRKHPQPVWFEPF